MQKRDHGTSREGEFYFTEGEKYFILEDYAKALLYFQKCLTLEPDNATVHYKIAEVLSRGNKQEDLLKASLSIENALELEKKNKYFYILASHIYTALARFDKAAEMYESLIAEIPGSEEYLYELAALYQYAAKDEEAIKTYNRAEEAFGVNEVSSVQKLRLYMEAGKSKEAVTEGEKLIKAYPGEERFIMAFAEVLSQNNQTPVAISYLENFLKENGDAGNVKMLLAGFYRDTQQEPKARKLLTEVFKDESVELSSKLIILGAYNTELSQARNSNVTDRQKEEFIGELYGALLTSYPENASVRIIGGDYYLATGKPTESVKEYLEAIALDEVNYEVWQNLLYLESKLELYDSIINHAEEALITFPNQGMLYYFNGYAHLRKRNYDEAVASFEQCKKLSGSNTSLIGDINAMLGDAYHALKRYDQSDKAYDEALTINPNNDVVLNNYSYYLALRKHNLEKAEKMAEQLIKNNPNNATYLDTYAWVLYMREKYKDAKKVMEKAIETGKANATHFEHYGDILFKLGDVEAAVGQWEKAKGLNANNETLNKKIANRRIYE